MTLKLYQKIGLVGITIASILLGGCINRNKESIKFQDQAYHYLVDEFTTKNLYSTQSPLFDFNDPVIRQCYEETKVTAKPEIIPRDTQSNYDIEDAVKRHLDKYGDRSLIIVSGAGWHIWGATKTLEDKFDAEYISITPEKLDFNDFIDSEFIYDNEPKKQIEEAKESTKVQLTRGLGVIRYLGYDTLEEYIQDISDFDGARNIGVGLEETGLHCQYNNQDRKPIYQTLTSFIKKYKPNSILYIGEDLCVGSIREEFKDGTLTQTDFFTGEPYYRTQFLNVAKQLNIPVEFASFGR